MLISYQEKSIYLKNKFHLEQSKLSKYIFRYGFDVFEAMDLIKQFNDMYGINAYQIGFQLNQAKFKRKQRIQFRITAIVLSNTATFLTLTFRDDVIATTNEATRKKYVSRYCNSISPVYVANVDYGDKKDREHYHAVVQSRDIQNTWSYGFSKVQIINNEKLDLERISKYIAKLTNHALKETGQLKRIIYSKKMII